MSDEASSQRPGGPTETVPGAADHPSGPADGKVVWFGPDRSDGVITLAGGRRVGVAQFGRPQGSPVIWCHGGLSSRIDAALAGGAAARNGIRLIALDRPGIGRSTLAGDDDLLRWPGIVAECADHLGLDSFGVAGWSAGGPFALACAYLLRERVRAVATVAGMYPVTDPARRRELGLRVDRSLIVLSRATPRTARTVLRPFRVAPDSLLWRSARRTGGPAERAALTPDSRPTVVRMLREAMRQGPAGVIADYRAFGSDWGFTPEVVSTPVSVWHGEADGLVPLAHAERLADALPAGSLSRVPGAGHFLHATHGQTIMASLRTALD